MASRPTVMAAQTFQFLGLTAVYASPAMLRLIERARRFAQLDEVVLIDGESGSGKEIFARCVHAFSPRSAQPWIDINCAALPENLLESELFGYEKGAFSGADGRKQGLLELAEGGTIFLDEIGELDLRLQAKLLRLLDGGEFFRLGGTRKVRVDARIVAATNQELEKAVAERRFRNDLYHRLVQLRLTVPPLRERPEDILPLAELFREKYNVKANFAPEARAALAGYHWPGNVRELRNAIIQCAVNTNGDVIAAHDLPFVVQKAPPATSHAATADLLQLSLATLGGLAAPGAGGILQIAEKRLIFQVLGLTDGNQERAATLLGISSRTLSRKLKAYHAGTLPPGDGA